MKRPIYTEFNLDAKVGISQMIAITHTDDRNADVLEVNVRQNGAHIDLTGATVFARMVLHKDRDYLLSDSVPCTVNDSGNVLIPFDNAVIPVQKGNIKIEVNLTQADSVLTLQFPLWVSVNGSILDEAELTPESKGTVPDLLKDAADALEAATEALENLGDYDNLDNKPQINGVTLSGDQSADDLGLQKKLTAGANILIDANGNISVTGVTKYKEELNYTQLDNCTENGVLYYITIGGYDAFVVARNGFDHIRQFAIVGDKRLITRRKQEETPWQPAGEWSEWEEIGGGSQIVSGVVNQNGTITFTDSDGNTFTTTGASVIGPQGAPGNDYVLTAQDKSDIAALVLAQLPTTQGVLYGNSSN